MKGTGKHLSVLRKEQGLSYRRLAERVGISHNALASYERESMEPSFENVLKICRYFNVPVEYLLTGDREIAAYHDLELMELLAAADHLDDDYRGMVKTYIRSVIRNAEEKQKLATQALKPTDRKRRKEKMSGEPGREKIQK